MIMEASIEAQLDTLRAAKLPRLQRSILKITGESALRKTLVNLTSPHRTNQQALLLQIAEDGSMHLPALPAADPDGIESQLAIICGPLLPEHRLGIFEDYEDNELGQLWAAAIERLPDTNMRLLILGVLQDGGTSRDEPDAAIAPRETRRQAAAVVGEMHDTKLMLASIEWDDDGTRVSGHGCPKTGGMRPTKLAKIGPTRSRANQKPASEPIADSTRSKPSRAASRRTRAVGLYREPETGLSDDNSLCSSSRISSEEDTESEAELGDVYSCTPTPRDTSDQEIESETDEPTTPAPKPMRPAKQTRAKQSISRSQRRSRGIRIDYSALFQSLKEVQIKQPIDWVFLTSVQPDAGTRYRAFGEFPETTRTELQWQFAIKHLVDERQASLRPT
jgi:hypothetical protein